MNKDREHYFNKKGGKMQVGQTVFFIKNGELCCGTMVFNNKGIIVIKREKGMSKIRISHVADRLNEDAQHYFSKVGKIM